MEFSRRFWALHTPKDDKDNTKLETERWAPKDLISQLVLS